MNLKAQRAPTRFSTDQLSGLGHHTGCVRALEGNNGVCIQVGGDHQTAEIGHYRRDQAYAEVHQNR